MAKTFFSTNDALTKKVWEEELFDDVTIESYFSRFMGESKESLVQVKTELTKQQGDQITFGIRYSLKGAGVTSGQILEGNEERLSTDSYPVSLEQYRHGVRDRGALDRKRVMFSIDNESKDALKVWGGEKIDQLCFNAILAAHSQILYRDQAAGKFSRTTVAATAKAALSATNSKLTLDFITALGVYAKTGGNGTFERIRPVKVDSKPYYILLVNPNAMYDLKIDTEFKQAMRDAMERGKDNPLFRGATAIWSDIIIHESERVPVYTDGGGGTVTWANCVLMGAQALVWAWGARGETKQETFDYGNEHGFAWEMISAVGKPVFGGKTYGSIGVYLATSAIANV